MAINLYAFLVAMIIIPFLVIKILSIFNNYYIKKKYPDISEKDANNVIQLKSIEIEKSFETTFYNCMVSLEKVNKCKIKSIEKDKGKIAARIETAWNQAPSKILINLTIINPQKTRVEITSSPCFYVKGFTRYDFGKNYNNVEIICNSLIKTTD